MEQNDRKIYLEFIFEGVVKVEESKVKELEEKIGNLVKEVFSQNKSMRLTTQISKYSEEEIMMSVFPIQGEEGYDN